MVMVPCWASTVPVFRSCTGPTRLGLTVEGEGPKYVRGTNAPTDGGAGNKSHPGPGPIGPAPGPCAELNEEELRAEAAAGSSVPGFAVARFARTCMAIASLERGSVAVAVTSAMLSELTRPPRMKLLSVAMIRLFEKTVEGDEL